MKDTIEILAKTNKPKYNLSKLAEELFELGEVVMKTLNKSEKNRPPVEKFIEEAGDTMVRLSVVITQFGVMNEVEERVKTKCEELNGYLEKEHYVGGV